MKELLFFGLLLLNNENFSISQNHSVGKYPGDTNPSNTLNCLGKQEAFIYSFIRKNGSRHNIGRNNAQNKKWFGQVCDKQKEKPEKQQCK